VAALQEMVRQLNPVTMVEIVLSPQYRLQILILPKYAPTVEAVEVVAVMALTAQV
jgi:hypothetical protein